MDRKELKRAAKWALRESRPSFLLVTLVYLLISYGASVIGTIFSPLAALFAAAADQEVPLNGTYITLTLFLGILFFFFCSVMQFGYTRYSLHIADEVEGGYHDLFSGFAEVVRVVVLRLILLGFYLVWCVAILLPAGIMVTFMTLTLHPIREELAFFVLVVFYLVAALLLLYIMTRYGFATLILADDPTVRPIDAVRRSRGLLRDRSWEFLKLQFSFLNWGVLGVLIYVAVFFLGGVLGYFFQSSVAFYSCMLLGLLCLVPLLLWLQPYSSVTYARYYRCFVLKVPLDEAPNPAGNDRLPTPETPWRSDGFNPSPNLFVAEEFRDSNRLDTANEANPSESPDASSCDECGESGGCDASDAGCDCGGGDVGCDCDGGDSSPD